MIGPAMAERLKLSFKDVVEVEFNGKKVKGAVWIQAGHPDNSITVFLGYGAPVPVVSAPAPASTFIRCGRAKLHGSRTV